MRTIENPKKLFRQINATEFEDDEYTFYVDNERSAALVGEGESIERRNTTTRTVEFTDLSTEKLERESALAVIQEAATEVDDSDGVPDTVDTKFVVEEDGDTVVYMCNTDRMGYEVISQKEPKQGGYTCIFPSEIVKVREEW